MQPLSVDSTAAHRTDAPTSLPTATDNDPTYTVEFAGGLELDVTPSKMSAGASKYANLSSIYVAGSDASSLVFADNASSFEGFYGFSPEGDVPVFVFPFSLSGVRFPLGECVPFPFNYPFASALLFF